MKKIAKLYLLEASHRCLKTSQKHIRRAEPCITEKLPFKKLKILSFLAPFISKTKTAEIFIFLLVKYFGRGLLFLKIRHKRVNDCWSYGPSNLLFLFFHYRLAHLDNRQTKIAEISKMHFLKANTKTSVFWKFQVLWPTHHKMTVL